MVFVLQRPNSRRGSPACEAKIILSAKAENTFFEAEKRSETEIRRLRQQSKLPAMLTIRNSPLNAEQLGVRVQPRGRDNPSCRNPIWDGRVRAACINLSSPTVETSCPQTALFMRLSELMPHG